MAETAERHAAYEDLLRVPSELLAEILGGSQVTHPRPPPRHALASFSLGDERVSPPPFDAIGIELGALWA